MNPARAEAIRRLDSIISGLNAQVWQLGLLRAQLLGGDTKVPSSYDVPAEDAEVVAERFGVPPREDAPGATPEWFEERLRRIAAARGEHAEEV